MVIIMIARFCHDIQHANYRLVECHNENVLCSSATHQELRCDVIIDVIDNIYLETTTNELYLDDSPEEFLVRAMNQDGRLTWSTRYYPLRL